MSLRLVQVAVRGDERPAVDRILDDVEAVDVWFRELVDDRLLVSVLLPSERTEALSDAFRDTFAGRDDFRLVLLAVEATVPRLEETETPGPPDSASAADTTPGRLSREELQADVEEGAHITRVYVLTVILSSVLAAVGLIRDDVAVLVGAMVVAPLLGPNMALAFATTLGDLDLVVRSLKTTLLGVGLALAFSLLVGMVLPVDPTVAAIARRTHVGVADVAVALAAGSAGALTFTTGLPSALVGVMVAVALLPPLVSSGLLLGSGHAALGFGSLVLVATNVVCLNLAGVVTFMAQAIRPRTWWEEERAKRAKRVALALWAVLLAALLLIIYTQLEG
ncbi:MAG: TIGR00341 family protein [Gemmatimonadota bacterium]|jgi:uncharacterized hydrophobic protein (TIGR00341 family)